jgi:cobalt-zinc-cadmium efflux system protein
MSISQTPIDHNEHEHGHEHGLHHAAAGGKKDLLIALSITLLMMIAEVIGGLLSNSLALLSDAGHMLTDNLALLLSFFAMTFSTLPATERKTFGFYRLYIIYQAYLRIIHPQHVEGTLMMVVAFIGLIANIIGALVLMKHRHNSLNIRGAYLHIIGDALSSVGVVIGGVVIIYTGWYLIDPILSIMISLVIMYGAWSLVKESVNILLESVPARINIDDVAAEIAKITGVQEAYHIHLWTITSGVYAMSAHVLIDDQLVSRSKDVREEIQAVLFQKFNVSHSTIQLECEKCDLNPVCSLPGAVRYNR